MSAAQRGDRRPRRPWAGEMSRRLSSRPRARSGTPDTGAGRPGGLVELRAVGNNSRRTVKRSSSGSSSIGAAAAPVSSVSERRIRRMRSDSHAKRRAVAYIRESTEEQGKGYSPDGQRQSITALRRRARTRAAGGILGLRERPRSGERPGLPAADRGRARRPLRLCSRLPLLTLRRSSWGVSSKPPESGV
jgi:hypothetical protein